MTIVEWDERKAARNLAKHRVSFELAATAFDDPFALALMTVSIQMMSIAKSFLASPTKACSSWFTFAGFAATNLCGESLVLAKRTRGSR